MVMHDNPDPDAIAAGWGLEVLIRERLGIPVEVVAGGAIVRAENRHMVELLQPPIELVDEIRIDSQTATILVDCGAEATNHLLTRQAAKPTAIIDHHVRANPGMNAAFEDIRPEIAASATIIGSYLREHDVSPGVKLATAMLYAIRTETRAYETRFSRLDRDILPWLTEQGDPSLLAEIENAPLGRNYFGDLSLALQNTFLNDDTALCFLPRAASVEIVGEVADLLIRCEGIGRILCAAEVGGDLFFSARTQPGFGSAVHLLLETLGGLGGAGGHAHRAGGKLRNVGARNSDDLYSELRERWLKACGIDRKRGTRLIAKREIVENLEV